MKKLILICTALMLILSGCTVRSTQPAQPPVQPEASPESAAPKPLFGGKKKTEKSSEPKAEEVPASGTDLYLPEPAGEAAAASLAALRNEIAAADAACGIALLGYVSPLLSLEEGIVTDGLLEEKGYGDAYAFLREMTPLQCVNPAFSELYCLVPGADTVHVTVSEMVMDEYAEPTEEVSAVLYDRDGNDPVFLSADSNGWGGSNIRVCVTDGQGNECRFYATLLSNEGRFPETPGVWDFSITQ